jgi:hypothetical protein
MLFDIVMVGCPILSPHNLNEGNRILPLNKEIFEIGLESFKPRHTSLEKGFGLAPSSSHPKEDDTVACYGLVTEFGQMSWL